MQRTIVLGGLLLCTAATGWAQAAPSQAPDQPQRIEEKNYVRRISAGITLGLTPMNQLGKQEATQNLDQNPPVQLISTVDPKNDRVSLGATVQFAFSKRWAVAVSPAYRKTTFHGFIRKYVGVDNSSTSLDERAFTQINEDTKARFLDIPILIRRFSKEHTDPGARWIFEGGPVFRMVSNVSTARSVDPEPGEPVLDNIPLPYKKNSLGAMLGIGGQLIDDFGIRATPEVRFTRWFSRPFDSISSGRTRLNQIEILITFGF